MRHPKFVLMSRVGHPPCFDNATGAERRKKRNIAHAKAGRRPLPGRDQ